MEFQKLVEKTFAAWLGKNIGIRMGAPVESWTSQEIEKVYGRITDYPVDYGTFAADDDANGPLYFVEALAKNCSREITAEEMGEHVKNVLCREHGFFWWGGVGISTEHTAYHNLEQGMKAPQSGSKETNGLTMAEQIGGQIFSDCWGYVAAGNPQLAADLARKMSSVTHDGDGIEGGAFVAACIALAYEEKDAEQVILKAMNYINPQSTYFKLVQEIIDFYHQNPQDDKACLAYIQQHHGYDKYPGMCHILPNTAIMIMAMLYGQNDFTKTMTMLCEAGWDTDCTCGNVGSVMGALVGLNGIEKKWIAPIQDVLIGSSSLGSRNITTISRSALRFVQLTCQLQKIEMPKKFEQYFAEKDFVTRFDLVKATGGIRTQAHRYSETHVSHVEDTLHININAGFPEKSGWVYLQTYYRPQDVYDARYEPMMSPTVYPGETFTMTLSNPEHLDIEVIPGWVDEHGHEHFATSQKLASDKMTTCTMKIEPGSATVCQIGVKLIYHTRVFRSYVVLHELRVDRHLDCTIDFTHNVLEDWGIDFGEAHLYQVKGCTRPYGQVTPCETGLKLEDAMLFFSDADARIQAVEVEFELELAEDDDMKEALKNKGILSVLLEVQGTEDWYQVKLGHGQIEVIDRNREILSKINFDEKAYNFDNFALKNESNYGLIKMKSRGNVVTLSLSGLHTSQGAVGIKTEKGQSCILRRCSLKGY